MKVKNNDKIIIKVRQEQIRNKKYAKTIDKKKKPKV
jgi:hypothetical protein